MTLTENMQRALDEDGYVIVGPRTDEQVGDVINVIVGSHNTGEEIPLTLKVVGIATVAEWRSQCERCGLPFHDQGFGKAALKVIAE